MNTGGHTCAAGLIAVVTLGCGDVVIAYSATDTEASLGSDSSAGLTESSSGGAEPLLPDYVGAGFEQSVVVSFDDGQTWAEVPEPPFLGGELAREGLVRGGDRIVMVGAQSTYVTTDGMLWDTFTDTLGYGSAVAYGQGMFVSVGRGRRARSEDALGWIDTRGGTDDFDLQAIAYGNGRFVAVGDGLMVTSDNGVDWQETELSGPKLTAVAFSNGRFVAVGHEGWLIATIDGVTVEHEQFGAGEYDAIVSCDGRFTTVSQGVVRTSVDGTEWTEFSIPAAHGLACGGESFVALTPDGILQGTELRAVEPVFDTPTPLHLLEYTGPAPSQ